MRAQVVAAPGIITVITSGLQRLSLLDRACATLNPKPNLRRPQPINPQHIRNRRPTSPTATNNNQHRRHRRRIQPFPFRPKEVFTGGGMSLDCSIRRSFTTPASAMNRSPNTLQEPFGKLHTASSRRSDQQLTRLRSLLRGGASSSCGQDGAVHRAYRDGCSATLYKRGSAVHVHDRVFAQFKRRPRGRQRPI